MRLHNSYYKTNQKKALELEGLFNTGIFWNAIFYIFEKGSYWLISIILFSKLSSYDFSIWANVNSIVYLVLLWADFGFRKSLPRYLPFFLQSSNDTEKNDLRKFLFFLVKSQLFIFSLVTFIFWYCIPYIIKLINIPFGNDIIIFAFLLFLLEGIITFARLIFHAYFWHKKFNLMTTYIVCIEFLFNFMLITFLPPDITLVKFLFVSRIAMALITIISSCFLIRKFWKNNIDQKGSFSCSLGPPTKKEFVKHSAFMWGGITIKSLSERNFMLPLLTYFFGSPLANVYKVINDSAILFQRALTKTIGTTDTSLLTYAAHFDQIDQTDRGQNRMSQDHMYQNHTMIFHTLNHIMQKIIKLTIIIVGVLLVFMPFYKNKLLMINDYAIVLFLILVFGYLLEVVLSPYERFLEVKCFYKQLFLIYLPYTIIMILIITTSYAKIIGLVPLLLLIQATRITTSVLSTIYVRKMQKLNVAMDTAMVVVDTAEAKDIAIAKYVVTAKDIAIAKDVVIAKDLQENTLVGN